MTELTIAETQEEIDRIEGHFHEGEESDWSAHHAVLVLKQLIATMQENAKLREALRACLRFYESKEAFGDDATINTCAVQFATKCEPLIHAALGDQGSEYSNTIEKKGE